MIGTFGTQCLVDAAAAFSWERGKERESVSSKSFLFGSETMVIDRDKYHKGSNCVSGFGQSRYLLRIMAIHFKVRIVLLCFTWGPVY